jgi:glycosyltransferase involved in cell wall biosynthesis
MAARGDNVTVLTYQLGNCLAEEWISGVRVLRFPLTLNFGVYALSSALFRYLHSHEEDFDLVHAHSYHTLAGHAAVGTRLPFVFTPHYHGTGHTPIRTILHHLYRPMGERLLRAADAVICVSDAELGLLVNAFPAAVTKAVKIPNGTERKPAPAGTEHQTADKQLVLSVGRLERYKNIDLIIDAFQALPSPASLVVVGDGPDRPRLERHTRAGQGRWPVIFTGKISDAQLGGLLAQASVVTSASDHEAFGLTLAEGLAAGARVVASAIPAHAEIAELAGAQAPVVLVDPRDTGRFSALLAASVRAGRVPAGQFPLPSWAAVVAATQELYARVAE